MAEPSTPGVFKHNCTKGHTALHTREYIAAPLAQGMISKLLLPASLTASFRRATVCLALTQLSPTAPLFGYCCQSIVRYLSRRSINHSSNVCPCGLTFPGGISFQ